MITGLAECPAVRRKVLRKVETNFNVLQPHAAPTNAFEDVTNTYPEAVPGQLQMALSPARERLRRSFVPFRTAMVQGLTTRR